MLGLDTKTNYYLRHAKVMFSSLSVALSVCLSVCWQHCGKRLNEFSWNFQARWDLTQRTIGNIFRMFHITPWAQDLFSHFSDQSTPLRSIAEKRFNGFSWNFQKRTDMTEEAIWNIFGMLRLTYESWVDLSISWIRVFCNIMEKRVNGFSWFFYETSGMTQKIINLTVSYLLRLFHGLPSRRPGVFVSNTTVKSMSGFSWNFQDMLAVTQKNNLEHFGDDRFNPLGTGFRFPFSESVIPDGWTFMKFSGYGHEKQ